jgi:hypothetical protein
MFEQTHTIKPGFGCWETTVYPLGGDFCRPSEPLPVQVTGEPQKTQFGYLVPFVTDDGRKLWAQEKCFISVD